MSSENTVRKLKLKAYLRRFGAQPGLPIGRPPR
jgi:hypothetical protein